MSKLIYEIDVWSDQDLKKVILDIESIARDKCTIKEVCFSHENREVRDLKLQVKGLEMIEARQKARIKELADELLTRPPREAI